MPVTVSLNPSRTYKCRRASWTQIRPGVGLLTVEEGRAEGKLKITGQYLVKELTPTYCRRFKVEREVAAGGGFYWCGLGNEPTSDSCDCQGFESYSLCKHCDSLRALLTAGLLVAPTGDPVSCFTEDGVEYEDPA